MAVITIDGVKLNVPDGANVLDCALENGIYIPHLCHHKDLNPLGSCRMCIVELEGQEGVVTSCTLKAKDGMVIHTKTEEVTRLRMLALELLLAGHPEDCSTCPKYGNCELQMLIQYIGPKTGRLKMRVKGFKENTANPLIVHDMNRCVLCGRCVRACNELRGVKVLDYHKRGLETYVGTLHDKLLADVNCRFCQACAEVCPTGTIRDKLATTEKKREDYIVPCKAECPAHAEIPRYLRAAKEGDMEKAIAIIREKLPIPRILGYICTQACATQCKRNCLSDPMSIRLIKRYAADKDIEHKWRARSKQLPDTGKKVCVVGAGPAGLSAAYYLRKQGHDVTIKEAMPTAGGTTAYGIPAYRLPRDVIAEEVKIIEEQGVKIECGVKVTKPAELLNDYDAVLMAVGGTVGVRLGMPGNDLPGVLLNADFLRDCSMGKETGMGEHVIVLGGGNVAFDCARSAVRLGAKSVHLACLEAREKMTADDEEIEQAQEEGVVVHPGQTFERITGEDHVTGVDFMKVKAFYFDENRRAVIEKEEGSELHIDADTVIFATGQKPDLNEESGFKLFRGAWIVVNDNTNDKQTSIPGIFAAGDCVYGTKSVVMAVQSGREAASQIDKYLGGDGDISEVLTDDKPGDPYIGVIEGFANEKACQPKIDPAEERKDNFRLFDHGICDEDICKEAGRCLQCDLRLQIHRPHTWGDYAESKEA